jgi:hypothetical protein
MAAPAGSRLAGCTVRRRTLNEPGKGDVIAADSFDQPWTLERWR